MDMNPKAVGERSEGQILAAFLRAGKVVLTPFGDNQRYDMVLDEGGKFTRVQCKTAQVFPGYIQFPTCSNNWNTKKTRTYRGEADIFAVYAPGLDKVYLVPVDEVGVKCARLRLEAARQGQKKNIRWASDYEFKG